MSKKKPDPLLLTAILALHVAVCALTWRDLSRRPAERVRGSKQVWRVASALNTGNSAAYWLFGRK
ncbi:hypothetical protein [Nakamurella lactea]|uniref:hypothetical protein n=1 Tax=Nakamurella lactea TaxID=459515 RepID=UPI00041ED991|nr:hypothetical protein [Nakamurella lactea]